MRRSGQKITKVGFIVAHDTGNLDSTAHGNVKYFKDTASSIPKAQTASTHIFVDDVDIIECIPAIINPEKAWHVLYDIPLDNQIYGDDANDIAIGVELCFFTDKVRSQAAYLRYVWVLADLCFVYKLNPRKDIIGHETLDPKRKIDPTNGLKYSGYTFNDLIIDVEKDLKIMNSIIITIEDAIRFLNTKKCLTDTSGWLTKAKADKNIYDIFMALAKGWDSMKNTKYFDVILQNVLKNMKGL